MLPRLVEADYFEGAHGFTQWVIASTSHSAKVEEHHLDLVEVNRPHGPPRSAAALTLRGYPVLVTCGS